jgi:hypothetical protein
MTPPKGSDNERTHDAPADRRREHPNRERPPHKAQGTRQNTPARPH